MSMLRPQTAAAATPAPTMFSGPYWEGCALGELRHQLCSSCGASNHTPTGVCASCDSSQLEWRVSSGRGVIHTWTVVMRAVSPDFEVPYAPAIIEMAEGWYLLSAVIGCDHTELAIGRAVEVEFHPLADGTLIPYVSPTD
ncbi:MAG: hypothetical protein EBX39_05920 [Actinobacteria bacterium]|nr:hypothetical protein [Actinomycetota bacterium]